MNHEHWLKFMKFPEEWASWDLLPRELQELQSDRYELGQEHASEHDRHGAFQWWLKRDPSPEILVKLARLTWLDPDPKMSDYVRKSIGSLATCNALVQKALITPYVRP
jgi:hypothetical protein